MEATQFQNAVKSSPWWIIVDFWNAFFGILFFFCNEAELAALSTSHGKTVPLYSANKSAEHWIAASACCFLRIVELERVKLVFHREQGPTFYRDILGFYCQ